MGKNTLTTLRDYLGKNLSFLIPHYQRGYIWGKSRDSEKDSVQYLIESIKDCFEHNTDLFLQGVTVSEHDNKIELIDGQQRTTVLYLLLHYLGYKEKFDLDYSIRSQSHDFLNALKGKTRDEILALCDDKKEEQYQDIYFFKKTIRIIHKEINEIDNKPKLLPFLLEHIKFLYINIPQEKATTVFTMMNGNKAQMKVEEIIKAEMLRLVSQEQDIQGKESKEQEAERWKQNLLRSRYAREWDKWLYWWSRPKIQKYYHTDDSVMGLLVKTYFHGNRKKTKDEFNFDNFRDDLLRGNNDALEAKKVFAGLRKLQKRFEDVYNSVEDDKKMHNKIGVILTLFNKEERTRFIRDYFLGENQITNIEEYLKLVYLGLSHTEIMKEFSEVNKTDSDEEDKVQQKKDSLLAALTSDNLYNEENEYAFRELLRRNIEQDTLLGRVFNFDIWESGNRSLEHIYPKSKVYHADENGNFYRGDGKPITPQEKQEIEVGDKTWLNRDDFENSGSEHCIGNLVLLYKNENSGFGAQNFDKKKSSYFDLMKDKTFRSRHLLHSISVFAKGEWGVKQIQGNKNNFITKTKEYYGIQ